MNSFTKVLNDYKKSKKLKENMKINLDDLIEYIKNNDLKIDKKAFLEHFLRAARQRQKAAA